jgi:heptosyltransferase-2/heptosyltransferase-3
VKTAVDFSPVRNVLILRTDHLGDLLLSTPLIRTLRTALPGRRFVLVASPANQEALLGWNGIDEIRLFDPKWSLQEKWQFAKALGREQWDLCLTLSPRTPSYLLGYLSGAPIRAGIIYSRRILARLLSSLWLTHPVIISVDEKLAENQPIPHEVVQLAGIAAVLGLADVEPGPLEIPLGQTELNWAEEWLREQDPKFSTNQSPTLIGIHGAGKWLSHGWTSNDFLQLVQKILVGCKTAGHHAIKILLTFGPGDRELESSILQALQQQPIPNLLLPGLLPVPRWAAMTSRCDLVISPDTGSLHLAVAVGCPVVALYEAASFLHCSTQWAPWQTPHAIVRRTAPTATIPVLVAETVRLLGKNEADNEPN